jgi:nanoRNase/pAp phosphatase (c-di-AMP/oligoRNAs hydrolase)
MAAQADPKARIIRTIEEERRFLISSHVSPDGDAVGSMAGLGWLLRALGKEVAIHSPDPIPSQYSWLEVSRPRDAAKFRTSPRMDRSSSTAATVRAWAPRSTEPSSVSGPSSSTTTRTTPAWARSTGSSPIDRLWAR